MRDIRTGSQLTTETSSPAGIADVVLPEQGVKTLISVWGQKVYISSAENLPSEQGLKLDQRIRNRTERTLRLNRIVLSRKGFDSSSGGKPSPIFTDGRILSLPIPAPKSYNRSSKRFLDISWDSQSIAPFVECLSNEKGESWCHLDPDLRVEAIPRHPEWRPAIGQADGEQTHLAAHGVGQSDLFLFFGMFRRVEQDGTDGWRFVRTAPTIHLLFGWLQVHEVLSLRTDADYERALRKYPWLSDHPHLHRSFKERHRRLRKRPNNTVYVSTPKLNIEGIDLPGGRVFQKEDSRFVLTDPEEVQRGASCRRSYWRLPEWFWPDDDCSRISRKVKLQRRSAPWIHVGSGGRGQEFVVDVDGIRDTANEWLRYLFEAH